MKKASFGVTGLNGERNVKRKKNSLETLTFQIYCYILKHNPAPVANAEIRRHFGLTHQACNYHLQKLVKAGLIQNVNGKYKPKQFVQVGILKNYILIANRYLISKTLIIAFLFLAVTWLSLLTTHKEIIQILSLIHI